MNIRDGWFYPDIDPRLRSQATPLRQLGRDAMIIDLAMKYAGRKNLVIQAGARIGLWPALLSEHYERVIAFEPETRNYECAHKNLDHAYPRVDLRHAALGATVERRWVEFSTDTSGSHQIIEQGGEHTEPCDVVTIDSLGVDPDAIFLDIEGFELFALKGAAETLARCHPMLVLEENNARLRYGIDKGHLAHWLLQFGYRVVDRHNKDLILT